MAVKAAPFALTVCPANASRLNVGWISPVLNERAVSVLELRTTASSTAKAKFINSDNDVLAIEKRSSMDEENDILRTKNSDRVLEIIVEERDGKLSLGVKN